MMEPKLSKWMKQIQQTQEQEIDCTECLDQVSRYVDLELAGGDTARRMPMIRQHLEQCQVCREEYVVLRDLARLEAEDHLPSINELLERLKHPKE